MAKIHVLEESVRNQIAAGEVVERPASVVKELIENALDSGADQIDVHIEEGGSSRIIVTDNGGGMSERDACLAFERYATSKIRTSEDIEGIASFGFRGEALASIGSVAKVSLLTREHSTGQAFGVSVEGGTLKSSGPKGGPLGTRVEVRDLFYNVPARRKFLRSERAENAAIDDVVRTAALASPTVGFALRVDGTVRLEVNKALADDDIDHPRRMERCVALLGKDARPHIFAISEKTDLVHLLGYVASPFFTRRDLGHVHLFVNGRPIVDRKVMQAIKIAYRSMLEVGRNPVCALNIIINPNLVDVNVHPQKLEVRFFDPNRVQAHIIRLLTDFLMTGPWLKEGNPAFGARAKEHASLAQVRTPLSAGRQNVSIPFFASSITAPKASVAPFIWQAQEAKAWESSVSAQGGPHALTNQHGLGKAKSYSELAIIGQAANTYLLLSSHDALIVVDQHAAHERVLFARLKEDAARGPLPAQSLLLPLRAHLSSKEAAALAERGELLGTYGFDVSLIGEDDAIIRALPVGIKAKSAVTVVKDALSDLFNSGRADSLTEWSEKIFARLACHGSIRAGQALSHEEIGALLAEMDVIDYAAQCPHGRPVVRAFTFSEIGSWFHRS